MQIPKAFAPLWKPKRYKAFFGGRGGAKSMNFALTLVMMAYQSKIRVLCTRETQKSILESVHKELADAIILLEDDHESSIDRGFFKINKTDITGKNGSYFFFEGLRDDPGKIRGFKGIDIVWCEEAETISEESWKFLPPTIRKKGSEIWLSFNTGGEDDATYKKFVAPYATEIANAGWHEDDWIYIAKVSYRDNPFLTDELLMEMELLKKNNYREYLHVWEGDLRTDYDNSVVSPEWFKAAIDAHKVLGFEPMGVRSMGFDLADEGRDEKAVAIRYGSIIEHLESWGDGGVDDAISKAFNLAFAKRVDTMVYDSVGLGASVKVGLTRRITGKNISIEGFAGSAAVRNPGGRYKEDRANKDVFRNLRAQAYWALRDRFEKTFLFVNKRAIFPPEELISISSEIGDESIAKLRGELTRMQRKKGQNSYIQIESKVDMLHRRMPSPNLADAVLMSFFNIDTYSSGRNWKPMVTKRLRVI